MSFVCFTFLFLALEVKHFVIVCKWRKADWFIYSCVPEQIYLAAWLFIHVSLASHYMFYIITGLGWNSVGSSAAR